MLWEGRFFTQKVLKRCYLYGQAEIQVAMCCSLVLCIRIILEKQTIDFYDCINIDSLTVKQVEIH